MWATVHNATRTHTILSIGLGITFLWAAVAKSLSLNQFATVVNHLVGGNDRGSPQVISIALGVISWEAMLAGLLLAGVWTRRTYGLGIATLLALSLVLLRLYFHPAPTTCGCFGFPSTALGPREDSTLGLVRNACLLVVCGWLFATSLRRSLIGQPPTRSGLGGSQVRAFTLIELLVVIVVIATLISLAVGTLGLVKRQGKAARSLATHQQLVMAVSMYAVDAKEYFPYIGTPGDPNGSLVVSGFDLRDGAGGATYFGANMWHWATLIVPNYWAARSAIESEASRESGEPGVFPGSIVSSTFFITHGCAASAAYWGDEFAPFGDQYFRGSRLGDVRFPSAKGLIWDASSYECFARSRDSTGILIYTTARADGSAGTIDIAHPQGDGVVYRPFGAVPFPVMATRHGLAGRDF